MYLLQTFPIFAATLMLANALPHYPSPSPSLTQRAPADLDDTETLELDVRNILMDASPPTGKVTLTRADARWNLDDDWLVYDVKGLIDDDGNPITATATTRQDGNQIDIRMIDDDALLGYGHDVKKGIHNQRWWMLESKEPYDIRKKEEVEIQLNYIHEEIVIGPFGKVKAVPLSNKDNDEDSEEEDEDEALFFTIPKWVDNTKVCAVTRVNGGRLDPDTVENYLSKNILLLYGYEEMEEPYRRRWWLVHRCPQKYEEGEQKEDRKN